jgi:hypothetical protein
VTDRPSNTGEDDREDQAGDEDELEEQEFKAHEPQPVREEGLTEIQYLERMVVWARKRYPHLITCHELHLLNALHPPDPALRKSLSAGKRKERDLFSDLEDEDPSEQDTSDED